MNNVREPNDIDALLDAVLADDDWGALSVRLKREALVTIGEARRRRRVRRWIGRAACVALLAGAVWWMRGPAPDRGLAADTPGQPAPAGARDPFVSEDEMLAMFPAGSCVIAEVDGRKELVFLDVRKAEEGFELRSR